MAEVLITLGIIGVVAALTLPPLIHHHNKVVWVNQLKKSVSTIEQAVQEMFAEEGVFQLSDTQIGSNIDEYQGLFNPKIYDIIGNYINIIKIDNNGYNYSKCKKFNSNTQCDWDDIGPGSAAYLSDGSEIILSPNYRDSEITDDSFSKYGPIVIFVDSI